MKRNSSIITVYAATHFLVDFACAFLIFSRTHDIDQLYISFLLYNFCAFALQMPLGLLADKFNRNAIGAALGCILIVLALGFSSITTAAVFAGVGNALFHIGGGIDVLNISSKASGRIPGAGRAGLLGVFVSPGALGIFLGKLVSRQGSLPILPVAATLLVAAGLIFYIGYSKEKSFGSDNVPVSFHGTGTMAALIAAICFFLVVCLRSYVGMTLNFPWKSNGYWGWALIAAVVLGKTAGGFFADRFGAVKVSAVSLILAAISFMLPDLPMAGVIALFLFNMTMPVTLWAMARLFPGAKGFSFGLLTFALFLGFVPVYLGYPPLFESGSGFTLACAVSLLLMVIGLRLLDTRVSCERLERKYSRRGA